MQGPGIPLLCPSMVGTGLSCFEALSRANAFGKWSWRGGSKWTRAGAPGRSEGANNKQSQVQLALFPAVQRAASCRTGIKSSSLRILQGLAKTNGEVYDGQWQADKKQGECRGSPKRLRDRGDELIGAWPDRNGMRSGALRKGGTCKGQVSLSSAPAWLGRAGVALKRSRVQTLLANARGEVDLRGRVQVPREDRRVQTTSKVRCRSLSSQQCCALPLAARASKALPCESSKVTPGPMARCTMASGRRTSSTARVVGALSGSGTGEMR